MASFLRHTYLIRAVKNNLRCLHVNLLIEEMFTGRKFDFVAFAKTMNIYYFLYSEKVMQIKFL